VTHLREEAAERRGAARTRTRGVVAVAHGPGTAGLLDASGATVVRALPNVAPSTAEMLEGIERAGADEIVVLPSESDIRPVAEAAAEQARGLGLRVAVLPTRSIVQTLAAVAVHDAESSYDDDVVAMTQAAGATRYGGVSVASREAVTSAGRCQVGDVLGIVGGDVVEIGASVEDVAVAVLERLLSTGGELITLVCGEECAEDVAATVARRVRRRHHGVEVVVYDGGQPFWPLILGVE
jgi:dihydroxyacetone kinase-like predicted kinase